MKTEGEYPAESPPSSAEQVSLPPNYSAPRICQPEHVHQTKPWLSRALTTRKVPQPKVLYGEDTFVVVAVRIVLLALPITTLMWWKMSPTLNYT